MWLLFCFILLFYQTSCRYFLVLISRFSPPFFTRSCLSSQDYVIRLRDEPTLEAVFATARAYYASIGATRTECAAVMLQLEFLYYKHDPAYVRVLPSIKLLFLYITIFLFVCAKNS